VRARVCTMESSLHGAWCMAWTWLGQVTIRKKEDQLGWLVVIDQDVATGKERRPVYT